MLDSVPNSVDDLPVWNYDGSSTGQAPGHDSEVHIKPRAIFQDPFRRGAHNILVLCDTYKPNGEPLPSNGRAPAAALFNRAPAEEPWFGIEQEYTLFKDGTPLGWPRSSARSFGAKPNPIVQVCAVCDVSWMHVAVTDCVCFCSLGTQALRVRTTAVPVLM